jgi:hypothetical protein
MDSDEGDNKKITYYLGNDTEGQFQINRMISLSYEWFSKFTDIPYFRRFESLSQHINVYPFTMKVLCYYP